MIRSERALTERGLSAQNPWRMLIECSLNVQPRTGLLFRGVRLVVKAYIAGDHPEATRSHPCINRMRLRGECAANSSRSPKRNGGDVILRRDPTSESRWAR